MNQPMEPCRGISRVDRSELLSRMGGDEKLLSVLAELFVEDAPRRLACVGKAVATANPAELFKSAHYLKGGLLLFGAPAADLAAQLEQMGRTGDIAEAGAVFSELQHETQCLLAALSASV
jgi:HPt (histidine-containing phosphotransfer) domain-containing protein